MYTHTLYQLTAGTANHNFELCIYAQLSPKPALGPACTNCPSQRGVRLIESQIIKGR